MRPIVRCLSFVIALLVLGACSTGSDHVKIGVSLPLTGAAATPGSYAKQGIELAVSQLPAQDRERIELINEDDQCNPTTGMTVAKKLSEIDNVHFVMGPICGAVINPTLPYYDSQRILRMHGGLGMDSYINNGVYRFTLLGRTEYLMKDLGEYSYTHGDRSVAILHLDDDYGKETSKYFEQYFRASGGTIVAKESFPRGELDYRTQILKIKEAEPDGLFLAAYGPQLIAALRQLNESDLHIPVYGLYNTEDPETIRSGGSLSDGLTYAYFAVEDSPTKTSFADVYRQRYNITNEMLSANAYDSFNLLWSAIKTCGEDVDCVRAQIGTTKDYMGASGKITIDKQGVSNKGLVIKRVHHGRFEVIG